MVYSNHQLITKYLDDPSEDNFEKIVKEFSPMVYSICYRVLNRGDLAEEASQATFLCLIEKKEKLVGGPSMIGWLHRVAYLSSLWLRKQENIRKKREKESKSSSSNIFPEQAMEESELHTFVDEAIQSLPSKYKDPLLLKFYENKTYKEIGLIYKTSEDSIRKRVNRGMEKIKLFLKKKHVVASSSFIGTFLASQLINSNASASSLPVNYVTPIITGKSISAINSIKIFKGVEQMILLTKLKATALVLSASIVMGASGMAVLTGSENSNANNPQTPTSNNNESNTTGDNNTPNKVNIGKPSELTELEYPSHNQNNGQAFNRNFYKEMNEKLNNDKSKFYSFWSDKAIVHAKASSHKKQALNDAIKNFFESTAKDGKQIHEDLTAKQKTFYQENGKVNYRNKQALKKYKAKMSVLYEDYKKSVSLSNEKHSKVLKEKVDSQFNKPESEAIISWLTKNNILKNQWSKERVKKDGKTFITLSYNYNAYNKNIHTNVTKKTPSK